MDFCEIGDGGTFDFNDSDLLGDEGDEGVGMDWDDNLEMRRVIH